MSARDVALVAALGCGVAGCGAALDSSVVARADGATVFEGPLSRAVCGPGSTPETGLQGQVSVADRESGRAAEGYFCNVEVVGQEGTNAAIMTALYEDCAYHSTTPANSSFGGSGVAVLDVSDSADPVRLSTLTTPAMLDPWESLKSNQARGLLGAVGPGAAGPAAFDVYDVSDCTAPALQSTLPVNIIGHEGEWAPDGLTYYGAGLTLIRAIDVENPRAPAPITQIQQSVHGLSVSDDGTRAYVASTTPNGLVILDTSQIQARAVNAQAPVVGSVYWEDGATAQHTIPVTIGGRPYVIFVDEGGYGAARIIDISDETSPVVVSKLKLEIHMAENRSVAEADGATGTVNYDGHYCNVSQRVDPEVLVCGYIWSGIRVFDIRDPMHPREFAYFSLRNIASNSRATAQPHFVKERGELWFALSGSGEGAGFYTVKFTNGVWPFAP